MVFLGDWALLAHRLVVGIRILDKAFVTEEIQFGDVIHHLFSSVRMSARENAPLTDEYYISTGRTEPQRAARRPSSVRRAVGRQRPTDRISARCGRIRPDQSSSPSMRQRPTPW